MQGRHGKVQGIHAMPDDIFEKRLEKLWMIAIEVQANGMNGEISDSQNPRWRGLQKQFDNLRMTATLNSLKPDIRVEQIFHSGIPFRSSSIRISFARFCASRPLFSGRSFGATNPVQFHWLTRRDIVRNRR